MHAAMGQLNVGNRSNRGFTVVQRIANAADQQAVVNGIETGANVQGFLIDDYKAFKKKGIAALRMDNVAIFQSGVVNVDPVVHPNLKNIARRRMADYIQDSIGVFGKRYGKKLSTLRRRQAVQNGITQFMDRLVSKENPDNQRIDGYALKPETTPEELGMGLYRLVLRARTLASLDAIVVATTIGETVDVNEI